MKKLLGIIGVIISGIVLAAFLLLVNVFTGNPISKLIAIHKVQQYINEVYSTNSKIDKTYYFAKDGEYTSHVKIGNEENVFTYYYGMIGDEKVDDAFQEQFNHDYNKFYQNIREEDHTYYLELPGEILIYTQVIADGNYDTDFEKLNVIQGIHFHNVINYDPTILENDSKNMAATIASRLLSSLGDPYHFTSIQMLYYDKFGAYEIIVDNNELNFDALLKHTRKMEMKELGEEGQAFIENLNP